ncbi:SWI/SNF and RSC complex subunit Ssr3 [Microbotryomycetes sp. JL221]|nr:SWI/SNF and RSC complex subunit Ssr3 [Microbotryomycetes sp. JL221]
MNARATQQQQQHQHQHQQMAAYQQQQQQHQQMRAQQANMVTQQQPGVAAVAGYIDPNEGLRAAKRRRPTDRSLPSSFAPRSSTDGITHERLRQSTIALDKMADSYRQLQDIERRIDWHVSRRKTEIQEGMAGARVTGVKRTLRLHVTTTFSNQPWQQTSNQDRQPDLTTGHDVPTFQVKLTGEIIGATPLEPKLPLTHYLTRAVIETDRNPTLYDRVGPFEWKHLPNQAVPTGLSFSIPSSIDTKIRINLYLDHRPERYQLIPPVANLLDLAEADKPTVLESLWAYVKLHGLHDDKRHIRTDDKLKPLFDGQERVLFSHLPEYVNRWMMPTQPVVVEHTIEANEQSGDQHHAAYDMTIYVPDPTRLEIEQVTAQLNQPNEKYKDIISFDEKIAAEANTVRTAALRRNFLASFASSPIEFLETFLHSQSQDLELVLGGSTSGLGGIGERGKQSIILSGVDQDDKTTKPISTLATWRDDIRKSDIWTGDWVQEAVSVFDARRQEKRWRDEVTKANNAGSTTST